MIHPQNVLPGAVVAGGPITLSPGLGGPPEALNAREKEIERRACELGRADGLRAGREQGLAEGREAAQAELRSARQALEAALGELAEARRRLVDGSRGPLLRLALHVARRIVRAEAAASAEVAARALDAATERARDAAIVRVRVHPRDKAAIDQACLGGPCPDVVADPAVSPGGCLVETECGTVDATVESQWDTVRAALDEALAQDGRGAPPDAPALGAQE
jgi:flagellar assembly protein FliH